MADSAAFWDEIADKYAKQPIKDRASYEKTIERVRERLEGTERVLEIGCGTGSTALLLAPNCKELIASDISSRMVEIARDKAAAEGVDNVRFDHANVFDEALEEGSFDVVMAFNLLHLVDDRSSIRPVIMVPPDNHAHST